MRHAAGIALALALLGGGEAHAHPHIWIQVESTVVTEGDAVAAIRHRWTFDPLFSAFEIEGLDANGDGLLEREELRSLADRYGRTLPPWSFFTEVRTTDGTERRLDARGLDLTHVDGRLVLELDLAFDRPVPLGMFDQIRVHDRSFFISLAYPNGGPAVRLEGAAGCTPLLHRPGQLDPLVLARLDAVPADVRELPPDLAAKVRDAANRIELDCSKAD
ncbi:MAG: DUF1007 family protein [Pseudomonadota bacterium]